VYDRYGDEDPDNRGGSGMASHMRRGGGQEMSPEDIFNAFFGGGMPGGVHMGGGPGGGGVHFYSTGFGPGGLHFRGGPARRPRNQTQQQNEQQAGFGMLLQMLPVLLFVLLSFLSANENSTSTTVSKGEGQYFSLYVSIKVTVLGKYYCKFSSNYSQLLFFAISNDVQNKPPFTNPMVTKLTKVKDIPYFVTDKFIRIFNRDRYQLTQVEHLVERAYENYLIRECKAQKEYKKKLYTKAQRKELTEDDKEKLLKFANEYELSRCEELMDLFPSKQNQKRKR
jgi:hypothetical protein